MVRRQLSAPPVPALESELPELTPPPSQDGGESAPPSQPLESAAPPSETPAQTPAPVPTADPTEAPTQAPAQTEAPEESAQASVSPEPQESQGVVDPDPAPPTGLPGWGWAGIGLAAGLVLAGAAALISGARARARRKKSSYIPAPAAAGGVRIEKLHEQGARKSQQDSFFVSADQDRVSADVIRSGPGLLAVVADGMGGLSDGDKVSQTAVSAMANGFYLTQGSAQQVLLALLEQANQAVNVLLGPDGMGRSGSTVVAGLLREGAFHCLSVGDSRICLYRDGVLYQLNREHIYRNELYLEAVNGMCTIPEAEGHPRGSGLTSYLGMGELKYVDIPAQPVPVRRGDMFILMSDGVYNALSEGELSAALADDAPADALRAAIQAKGYTNQDNYTAVILRC